MKSGDADGVGSELQFIIKLAGMSEFGPTLDGTQLLI